MRNILDIYKEYKIMPNLELHMLRAAAVASLICDNFDEVLPKEYIATACLFHDMGNILKFNFDLMPELLAPLGREYWQTVKDEYAKKYGPNEHDATNAIMRELNIPEEIIYIADQDRFSLLCEHVESDNFAVKIMQYADYRSAPYGVVSYDERMEESSVRYKSKDEEFERKRHELTECGRQIEKQIFSQCKIKPEDITDKTIEPIIAELKKYVIKY